MNVSTDAICETCLTSNGFNSTDRRSLLILTIVTSISLLACYIGVLWFAIRTRTKPEKDSNVTTHKNEAFDNEGEEDYDDYVRPVDNIRQTTASPIQQVLYSEENEKLAP